jgi:SAM-dependent methyltransferase
MKQSQITHWCHEIIRSQAQRGGLYVDATMGNGNDTVFLCELAGETGEVFAFDIQEQAVKATQKLLEEQGVATKYHLILDGHENMDHYIQEGKADVICFNFGYLPGGDHTIATQASTSIIAIQKGLELLKSGGMMCLCVYSGGDTGFEEKNCILNYLKELAPKKYTVIVNEYFNRGNNPPTPIFIFKK